MHYVNTRKLVAVSSLSRNVSPISLSLSLLLSTSLTLSLFVFLSLLPLLSLSLSPLASLMHRM